MADDSQSTAENADGDTKEMGTNSEDAGNTANWNACVAEEGVNSENAKQDLAHNESESNNVGGSHASSEHSRSDRTSQTSRSVSQSRSGSNPTSSSSTSSSRSVSTHDNSVDSSKRSTVSNNSSNRTNSRSRRRSASSSPGRHAKSSRKTVRRGLHSPAKREADRNLSSRRSRHPASPPSSHRFSGNHPNPSKESRSKRDISHERGKMMRRAKNAEESRSILQKGGMAGADRLPSPSYNTKSNGKPLRPPSDRRNEKPCPGRSRQSRFSHSLNNAGGASDADERSSSCSGYTGSTSRSRSIRKTSGTAVAGKDAPIGSTGPSKGNINSKKNPNSISSNATHSDGFSPAVRRRNKSPVRHRGRSPSLSPRKDRYVGAVKNRERSRSPIRRRGRSPSPIRRRGRFPSPIRRRGRSPSPIRRRKISPSPIRRRGRSPSPNRRRGRSPSPIRRRERSPSHIRRRVRPSSPIRRKQRSSSMRYRGKLSPPARRSGRSLSGADRDRKATPPRDKEMSASHHKDAFPPDRPTRSIRDSMQDREDKLGKAGTEHEASVTCLRETDNEQSKELDASVDSICGIQNISVKPSEDYVMEAASTSVCNEAENGTAEPVGTNDPRSIIDTTAKMKVNKRESGMTRAVEVSDSKAETKEAAIVELASYEPECGVQPENVSEIEENADNLEMVKESFEYKSSTLDTLGDIDDIGRKAQKENRKITAVSLSEKKTSMLNEVASKNVDATVKGCDSPRSNTLLGEEAERKMQSPSADQAEPATENCSHDDSDRVSISYSDEETLPAVDSKNLEEQAFRGHKTTRVEKVTEKMEPIRKIGATTDDHGSRRSVRERSDRRRERIIEDSSRRRVRAGNENWKPSSQYSRRHSAYDGEQTKMFRGYGRRECDPRNNREVQRHYEARESAVRLRPYPDTGTAPNRSARRAPEEYSNGELAHKENAYRQFNQASQAERFTHSGKRNIELVSHIPPRNLRRARPAASNNQFENEWKHDMFEQLLKEPEKQKKKAYMWQSERLEALD